MKKTYHNELYYSPPGKMIHLEGAQMHVYTAGDRGRTAGSAPPAHTLVFMAGWGTACPTLDFKPLWGHLADRYAIAVVEKFGYGWSDITDKPRDMDTVLAHTREAIKKAGHHPPYVLVPHSLSGLEALYWAQKHPEEVTAIMALDITVPEFADLLKISWKKRLLMKFSFWMRRFDMGEEVAKKALQSDAPHAAAYQSEYLNEEDRNIFVDMFRRRLMTADMQREFAQMQRYIAAVRSLPLPVNTPLLMVSGDFRGAAKEKKQSRGPGAMRGHHMLFASHFKRMKHIELDCGHYVHAHEPRRIADEIASFISGI